jgi:hypothetical protein
MGYKVYSVMVFDTGDKEWWINDKRHREDGPAVEFANGGREWWINGKLHREDGPALEFANGTRKWFIEGGEYTEKEFLDRKQRNPCDGKIVEIDGVKYKLKMVE